MRFRRWVSFALFLVLSTGSVRAQSGPDSDAAVVTNSFLTFQLTESNRYLRKTDFLFDAVRRGRIAPGRLHLGASISVIADYQRSNTDSKFGYLMRHPTSNNQIGKTVSEALVHSVQWAAYGAVNRWMAVYTELLYDPQQNFGAGSITSVTRNQVQLRKGYVLFANPTGVPVYGAIGKMNANFGMNGSVSPFTNTTLWHAFGGLGYGVMVGIRAPRMHASIAAVQGGAQFRALHVPVEGTSVPSRLNNLVADAGVRLGTPRMSLLVGASVVRGSAYCQGFPVVHFQPCQDPNAAGALYGRLRAFDLLTVRAGYAITKDAWPGSHNPNPPLNAFAASRVSSLSLGARAVVLRRSTLGASVSAEFSNFVAGDDGSPWERQNQWVVGASVQFQSASALWVEWIRTAGYAPLNFVSGGNLPNPGASWSTQDARSNVLLVGARLTL